jgi:Holliday junction resolvase RusA-like endonuclease
MDRRKWDIENRVKLLSDLLMKMRFWLDDSQVWDLRVSRMVGYQERTEIRIVSLGID